MKEQNFSMQEKIFYYVTGIFILAILFTGCYYLSYRNAIQQFEKRKMVTENVQNTAVPIQKDGEESLAVNGDRQNVITEHTAYVVQVNDQTIGKVTEHTMELPKEFIGFQREDMVSYLEKYMRIPVVDEIQKGLIAYELVEFSSDKVVVKKTYQEEKKPYSYYIGLVDNEIVVYYKDKKTIYEETGINAENLSAEEQRKLSRGIEVQDTKELYGILEDYSS